MKNLDDWCQAALTYRRIAAGIAKMEKAQEGGVIDPEVQKKIDYWNALAEQEQRKHEAKTPPA